MQETIKQLAEELKLSKDTILKAYKAYYAFIKEKIEQLPLKEDLTPEELKKYRTSFNVPGLGKFSCTEKRYFNIKNNKRYEHEHKEDSSNV